MASGDGAWPGRWPRSSLFYKSEHWPELLGLRDALPDFVAEVVLGGEHEVVQPTILVFVTIGDGTSFPV